MLPRNIRAPDEKAIHPSRPRVFPVGTLHHDGGRDAQERADGGRGNQSERSIRLRVRAPAARSRRGRRRLPHRMRGAHSRGARRSHRRLLHLGVAQAGHSHRRAHRAAALASGAIRRIRKQRQCHLRRRRAQPARRAAGAAHAGSHLRRRVLHRVELCLDLGNQPGGSRDRHQRGRPRPRRTPAGARRNRGRPYRQGDHRAKAAGGVQHTGRRIQLFLHARAASGRNARQSRRSPC